MKKFYTLVSAFLLSASLWAQAPQSFSYQAVVRGVNNELIVSKQVAMKISLFQGSENGAPLYVETHTPMANTNGLVSISIGAGTKVVGDFTTIDWAKGPYFLKTETDLTGGTAYSLTATSQLLSVPFALYAANSQPGPKGEKGDQGIPGKNGVDGKNGLDGKDGMSGPIGLTGPAGKDGVNGKNGTDGKVGPQGPQGIPGSSKDEQKLSVSAIGDTLYLTNGNFVIIPGISAANLKPTSGYGQNITDVDGNTYKTVYIGTQQWMAENLKTSKYNDGTTIPNVTDNELWWNLSTSAWCNYNNSDSLGKIYGKLYNWYTVSNTTNGNRNVCPSGWHVPTDMERIILIDYLGGESVAGGKMKEVGTTTWNSPNTEATNMSLFSVLASGYRQEDYKSIGLYSFFWSCTENNSIEAISIPLCYANGVSVRGRDSKRTGFSVRCVKD